MARYDTYSERRRLTVGMIVWAYAYRETNSKEGMKEHLTPTRGMIIRPTRSYGDRAFVKFKKNSTDLAMSSETSFDGRCYADTYEEAVEGYNSLIQDCINWHESKIKELTQMKIPCEPA